MKYGYNLKKSLVRGSGVGALKTQEIGNGHGDLPGMSARNEEKNNLTRVFERTFRIRVQSVVSSGGSTAMMAALPSSTGRVNGNLQNEFDMEECYARASFAGTRVDGSHFLHRCVGDDWHDASVGCESRDFFLCTSTWIWCRDIWYPFSCLLRCFLLDLGYMGHQQTTSCCYAAGSFFAHLHELDAGLLIFLELGRVGLGYNNLTGCYATWSSFALRRRGGTAVEHLSLGAWCWQLAVARPPLGTPIAVHR